MSLLELVTVEDFTANCLFTAPAAGPGCWAVRVARNIPEHQRTAKSFACSYCYCYCCCWCCTLSIFCLLLCPSRTFSSRPVPIFLRIVSRGLLLSRGHFSAPRPMAPVRHCVAHRSGVLMFFFIFVELMRTCMRPVGCRKPRLKIDCIAIFVLLRPHRLLHLQGPRPKAEGAEEFAVPETEIISHRGSSISAQTAQRERLKHRALLLGDRGDRELHTISPSAPAPCDPHAVLGSC